MFAYWWLVFAPLTLYTVLSLTAGTRLAGGYRKLCAFIRRSRATGTSTTRRMQTDSNSPSTPGSLSAVRKVPGYPPRLVSSSTGLSSSGIVMRDEWVTGKVLGVSGLTLRGPVDSGNGTD